MEPRPVVTVRVVTSAESSKLLHRGCMLDQADPAAVTPDAITNALASWRLVGIFDARGKLVGVAGADPQRFGHIYVVDEAQYAWSIRRVLHPLLVLLFGEGDELRFSIPLVTAAARKLVIFAGAELVQEDATHALYTLTRDQLAASPAAQSAGSGG